MGADGIIPSYPHDFRRLLHWTKVGVLGQFVSIAAPPILAGETGRHQGTLGGMRSAQPPTPHYSVLAIAFELEPEGPVSPASFLATAMMAFTWGCSCRSRPSHQTAS